MHEKKKKFNAAENFGDVYTLRCFMLSYLAITNKISPIYAFPSKVLKSRAKPGQSASYG